VNKIEPDNFEECLIWNEDDDEMLFAIFNVHCSTCNTHTWLIRNDETNEIIRTYELEDYPKWISKEKLKQIPQYFYE
jgi:hypothetical protein